MARIVVIEDERDLQRVLEFNLRGAGHDVYVAGRGFEGLSLARNSTTREASVVIVTAKGEEIDRIVGLELGADDYVVKPFSMRELLLRIDATLRRAHAERETDDLLEFGRLRIDRPAHRAWVDGAEVEPTALEFKLLLALYNRRNRVQTRAVLLDDVWGIEANVTTRTVDTHVKRLREKLGPIGNYVETVRGVGYRFTSEPSEESG